MKIKSLLAGLFLCFLLLPAHAQNDNPFTITPIRVSHESPVSLHVGAVLGANASMLNAKSTGLPSYGFRFGLDAGVFANVRFLPRNDFSNADNGLLAIQPEVQFSMMGGNAKNSNLGLSYITFPIMIQVYPTQSLYVEVGPMPAMNIGHTPNVIVAGNSEFHLDNLKANDLLVAAGVGYSFGNLSVGARYCHGLSKLAKNMPWKNQVIQVRVSYGFKLGGGTKKAVSIDF